MSTSLQTSAGPRSAVVDRFAIAAGDIKLSHSIFAMPFALLAAFLARPHEMPWLRFGVALGLVVVCMFLARSWAMLINRLADRTLDAQNPRTARRAFASGRLSPRFGTALTLSLGALFVMTTAIFWLAFANPWPLVLSIPVLLWIGLYSFTKRFTWACHLFLGTSLAASPLAAAIAIEPAALGLPAAASGPVAADSGAALWFLAAMVTLWVAGFDIIYSLQDVDEDRRQRLFSIPSRLGVRTAIWISRALHGLAVVCLIEAWRFDPRLGPAFGGGIALVAALLIVEHLILARRGKAGLDAAFFTMNSLVSLVVGGLGIADTAI
ncbi:MAG: putative 4-hydroxybenzoate polyprenyltransferase [Phycisphaeraceae bacterium]|nr:putative 4-hydroxybenzoate polyprenyltransferase [Phycisphaeraceae bacterium]